ncbi:hypothetical protein ScPMuIL_010951 [Solemya velum]
MAEEVVEEYESSLAELTFNSKPQINMLTMLAEDHEQHASHIVKVIEERIEKMDSKKKLPLLYLIDSIIKNLQSTNYPRLFSQNIVTTFSGVFEKVDEKTRQSMYKLRQTWSRLFPGDRLYALDIQIGTIDPAWPVTAPKPEPTAVAAATASATATAVGNIHVNPRFLKHESDEEAAFSSMEGSPDGSPDIEAKKKPPVDEEQEMRKQLLAKQQELLRLQTQRLELELAETKAKLKQQEKAFGIQPNLPPIPVETALNANKESSKNSITPSVIPKQNAIAEPTSKLPNRDPRTASRDPRLVNRQFSCCPDKTEKQHEKHSNIFTQLENMKNAPPIVNNLPFPFPVFNKQDLPATEIHMEAPVAQQPAQTVAPPMSVQQPMAPHQLMASSAPTDPRGFMPHSSGGPGQYPGVGPGPHPSGGPEPNPAVGPGPMVRPNHRVRPTWVGQPPHGPGFQAPWQTGPPPNQMDPRMLAPSGQMGPVGRQMGPLSSRFMGPDNFTGTPHGALPPHMTPIGGLAVPSPQNSPLYGNMPDVSQSMVPPPSGIIGMAAGQPVHGEMPPFDQTMPSIHAQTHHPGDGSSHPTRPDHQRTKSNTNRKDQKNESDVKSRQDSKRSHARESRSSKDFHRSKRSRSPRSGSSSSHRHSESKTSGSSKSRRSDDSRKSKSVESESKKIDKDKKDNSEPRTSDRRHRDSKEDKHGARSKHGEGKEPRKRSPLKRERQDDRNKQSRNDSRQTGEKKSNEKNDNKKSETTDKSKVTSVQKTEKKDTVVVVPKPDEPPKSPIKPFGQLDDVDHRQVPMDIDERRPSLSNEDSLPPKDVDIRIVPPVDATLLTEHEVPQPQTDPKAPLAMSTPKVVKTEKAVEEKLSEVKTILQVDEPEVAALVERVPVKRDLEQSVEEDKMTKKPRVDEALTVKVSPNKVADDLSDLFGQEDQDYRRLSGEHTLAALKSPGQAGWSNYKASQQGQTSPMSIGDVDHRVPSEVNIGFPQDVDMRRPIPQRIHLDRPINDKFPKEEMQDVKNAHMLSEDSNVRKALSMKMRMGILHKAESQRQSGEMSHQEHQELLRQLSSIDAVQKQHKALDTSQSWQDMSGRQRPRLSPLDADREYEQFRRGQPVEHHQPPGNGPVALMDMKFSHSMGENFNIRTLEEEDDDLRKSPYRDFDERSAQLDHPDHRRSHGDRPNRDSGMRRSPSSQNFRGDRDGKHVRIPPSGQNLRSDGDARHGRISPSNDFHPNMQNNRNNQFGRLSPSNRFSPNGPSMGFRDGPMPITQEGFSTKIQMQQPSNMDVPFPTSPDFNMQNKDSITVAMRLNDSRWNQLESNREREMSEEVVIDRRPYEIKVGVKPRIIKVYRQGFELYADPVHRAVLVDGQIVYKFGDIANDVRFGNRLCRLFYHGRPKQIWIDNQQYEVRIDAPPRMVEINGKEHTIQIDGRDMMILIDREEKGPCGGQPRFIFLDNIRVQLRFEPPPRQIRIDGKLCELKLNGEIPYIVFDGRPRGIRFDGQPKDVIIDGKQFCVPTDRSIRVKVGFRFHNLALGGPAHELIIDGKWYEVKFNGRPKEITFGSRTHCVTLEGEPPDVKILGELPREFVSVEDLPPQPVMPGQPPMLNMQQPLPNMMGGPGPRGPMPFGQFGPDGSVLRMMGPNSGPVTGPMGPGPGMQIPFSQPGMLNLNQPQMGPVRSDFQPGMMPNQPPIMNMPPGNRMQIMGEPSQQVPVSMGPGVAGMPMPLGAGMTNAAPSGPMGRVPQLAQPTPMPLDVNSLFQQLVNAGIIQKTEQEPAKEPEKMEVKVEQTGQEVPVVKKESTEGGTEEEEEEDEELEEIPDLTEFDLQQLRSQNWGVIQRLYTGIQCQTCGMRFAMTNTDKYREHLDWHFRQNRREKDELKITRFRRWYYEIDEWVQFEEVQDEEEKARSNFFESQSGNKTQEPIYAMPEGNDFIKCPPATGDDCDDICDICGDPFEQYWSEEHEGWHLRNAIRVGKKTYHPVCFEDAKENSILEPTPTPTKTPSTNPLVTQLQKLEKEEPTESDPITEPTTPITEPTTPIQDEAPSPDIIKVVQAEDVDDIPHILTTIKTEVPVEAVEVATIKTEPVVKTEPADIPLTTFGIELSEKLPMSLVAVTAASLQSMLVTDCVTSSLPVIKQEPDTVS